MNSINEAAERVMRKEFEEWAIGPDGPWTPRAVQQRVGATYGPPELAIQWDCWKAARSTQRAEPAPSWHHLACDRKFPSLCKACIAEAEPAPEMQASHGAVAPGKQAAQHHGDAESNQALSSAFDQSEHRQVATSAPSKNTPASADSAADARDAWISVEDRLPKDGVSVLIVMASGAIEKTCWHAGEFLRASAEQPTHWQPLPAPPNTPPARDLANPVEPPPQEHDALADVKVDEKGPI